MRFLKEPLVHFLLVGGILFLVYGIWGDSPGDRNDRIVVTATHIERLVEVWNKTRYRPPTQAELEGLIENHIREETLYREALALGLDRDDTVVRRRLGLKMEFLSEDLAAAEPTDEELQTYLKENPDVFRVEPRLTFSHVYLNSDHRGEAVVGDAEAILSELVQPGGEFDPGEMGDPLPIPHRFESAGLSEVGSLFGQRFAARLMEVGLGRWEGPVESGYGLHLVLVRERTESRLPDLSEAREDVLRDLLAARRREANDAFYRRLRERYTVNVQMPGAPEQDGPGTGGTQ